CRRRHTRSKRDWSSDVCSSDLQLLDGELVQQLAAGSGLLGLGLVGGESGDKLLEFLDLVLVALVLLLDEVLHQLGGLIPEVVVEIGRASCRERAVREQVGVALA